MIQATTPTYTFQFKEDFSLDDVKEYRITFKQGNAEILKTDADTEKYENNIAVRLTQEETLMFKQSDSIRVQIRLFMNNGDVYSTVPCDIRIKNTIDSYIFK